MRLFAIDLKPTRGSQHFAFGLKMMTGYDCDPHGFAILRWGEKHRQKTLDHKIVKFGLGLAQFFRDLQGWDNGKVIRYLGVIKDSFVRFDPTIFGNFGSMGG